MSHIDFNGISWQTPDGYTILIERFTPVIGHECMGCGETPEYIISDTHPLSADAPMCQSCMPALMEMIETEVVSA